MKKRFILLSFVVALCNLALAQTTDVWVAKSPFPDTAAISTFAFTIGSVAYYGTGYTSATCNGRFWAYDVSTDTWTQKADVPGGPRTGSQAFVLNGMGYVCMGTDCSFTAKSDIWQYNPANNSWTQKSNFPGPARRIGLAFTIGSYGYLGTGYDDAGAYLADFWKYDPTADSWTQKADLTGGGRTNASGFGFDNKGYICLGTQQATGVASDIWEYDVASNTWAQKANFQGVAISASQAFVIGGKGFIASGTTDNIYPNKKELWEYDTATNVWNQRTSLPQAVAFGSGFSVGNNGYVVGGEDSTSRFVSKLWQYIPLTVSGINTIAASNEIVVGPNPFNNQLIFKNLPVAANNKLSIFNALGQCVFNAAYNNNETTILLPTGLAAGVYVLQILNNQVPVSMVKLVKE